MDHGAAADHDKGTSIRPSNLRKSLSNIRRSIAGFGRLSDIGRLSLKKQIFYEPTYRLEPAVRFDQTKAFGIMERELNTVLHEKMYVYGMANHDCTILAENIKERIKRELKLDRYKLVCFVVVGEMASTSIQFASRCFSDTTTDTHLSAKFQNHKLFAIANLYAFYHE